MSELPVCCTGSSLHSGIKYTGKVRDTYQVGSLMILVTTDRLSAFDRNLCNVPHKGAVLNLTSAWWMQQTAAICPNALVSVPHPNITVMRACTPFKVEVVVRAYLTGTTSTSVWSHYSKGARTYCGYELPEGMKKNEPLPGGPWVTPTTKEESHDRPISGAEVVALGLMSAEDWAVTSGRALAVFRHGQAEAAKRGLILVDTKYEFGRDPASGDILLIDEVHTPDSSRYWLAPSYASRLGAGLEPENIDKEFLRIWFRGACDPYSDAVLPAAPQHLVAELSRRYIQLYETITGLPYAPPPAAPSRPELAAATAPSYAPAACVLLVLRTGDEGSGALAARAARELCACTPDGSATSRAVEVFTGNVVHSPGEVLEIAAGARGRVRAALVLPGVGASASAAVLALHGRMPVVCVVGEGGGGGAGASAAELPPGCPVVFSPSLDSAISFLSAAFPPDVRDAK